MEIWLTKSAYMHKEHGNIVRSKRTSKEMTLCLQLIKRIREDDYLAPNKVFTSRNWRTNGHFGVEPFDFNPESDKLLQQDLNYLMDYLKKHLLSFWD